VRLIQQMVIGVLLPICLGMSLRAWVPAWVARQQQRLRLQALGLAALLAIIAAIVANQIDTILGELGVLIAVAVLFTLVMLAAGWVLARPVPVASAQRRAILFGFPARNLSIATLLAVTVFDRPEMASFGVVFFIVQASGLIPIALLVGARDRALDK
jgi:BASS family bile acid:Na+ symporter